MLLTQPQTPRSKEKICSFVMQQCLAIWLNYETAKVLSVRLFIFVCLFLTGFFFVVVGFVRNHRTDSAAFQAVHGESRKWADLGTAKCFFLLDWQKTCWARPENIIFGHLCYVTCTQGNKAQLQKWNLKPMRRHVQRDLRTARTMVCY